MRAAEGTQTLLKIDRAWKIETEKRQKQIMRRVIPGKRTLANALGTMTRQELEDIRYNVGLSGTSKLNKAELIETLIPAIITFSRSWFVSMLNEEYQAMRHIAEREGISTQFRSDEMRLDYFQSLGLVLNGSYNGKPAWYMPNEVLEEFKKLNAGSLAKAAEWNTDAVRLAAGLLYYYGVLDYDQLFVKVKQYMEADETFTFTDFIQVMFNGACWQHNFRVSDRLMCYYTVADPERIIAARANLGVGFAKLPYDKVYDAGEENYIEATKTYKALAQFFMRAYQRDVLAAANIVSEITILLQNGGQMKDVLMYTDSLGDVTEADEKEMATLLMHFHNSLRLWILKGHTPQEIISGHLDPAVRKTAVSASCQKKKKVGRNDPCPCGSGKKYKNCCLRENVTEQK